MEVVVIVIEVVVETIAETVSTLLWVKLTMSSDSVRFIPDKRLAKENW